MQAQAMGTVYLVGAGPGAADLLTVRALRLLERADIVFFDALVGEEILAIASKAERIAVGKRCGAHSTSQRFINKRLVDAAKRHEVVVRLKGGDPMLFGRAHEEIQALAEAGVRCEVVPGISAAFAAAAQHQVSLTQRGVARSVAFVTPRIGEGESPHAWAETAARADTAIVYMGAGQAGAIRDALVALGRSAGTPVALVENAERPGTCVRTGALAELADLAERRGQGPALLVIGEVARGFEPAATAGGQDVLASVDAPGQHSIARLAAA